MLYVSVPAFISQVLVNAPNSLVKRTIWGLLGATKDGVPALPRSRVAQGRQGFVGFVPPCTRPPFLAHYSELRGNSAMATAISPSKQARFDGAVTKAVAEIDKIKAALATRVDAFRQDVPPASAETEMDARAGSRRSRRALR